MGSGLASRRRLLAGAALLAFWLGWVAVALTRPQSGWQADPVASADMLDAVLARLPADHGPGPLAVRLGGRSQDDAAWQALAAGIGEHGGQALALDAGVRAAGFEVLILAPGHHPVYAGPLVPDPALCGQRAPEARLRQWLPQLLVRTGVPLLLDPA